MQIHKMKGIVGAMVIPPATRHSRTSSFMEQLSSSLEVKQ